MLGEVVFEYARLESTNFVVIAPMKDEEVRFYVNYESPTAMTTQNTYPLSRMDEPIDCLVDTTFFFTIDCNSEYCQIRILEADQNNTTFSSHHGLSDLF